MEPRCTVVRESGFGGWAVGGGSDGSSCSVLASFSRFCLFCGINRGYVWLLSALCPDDGLPHGSSISSPWSDRLSFLASESCILYLIGDIVIIFLPWRGALLAVHHLSNYNKYIIPISLIFHFSTTLSPFFLFFFSSRPFLGLPLLKI